MRVLITGGGGFIGAWIIKRLLAKGHDVRVLDARADRAIVREIVGDVAESIDWRIGDVSRGMTVLDASDGCDTIFHLAAILTPATAADPVRGAEINLIGTLNVFEAARRHGMRRILYMSSAGVFGPEDGVTPRPTTHYGAFKLACEGSARAYWLDNGIASIGFRPLIVYGPGRETGLTAGPTLACRAAAEGRAYTIPFSGETDFLFVDDIAAAFVVAAEQDLTGAEAYTLVGCKADIEEFVELVRVAQPGARISAQGPTLPVAAELAASAVRDVLPGVPLTNLADGISRTIAHYLGRRTL